MSGRERSLPMRAIRAVGRFIVAIAVVGYTVLDELLFPLLRPLIAWITSLRLIQLFGAWLGRLPPYAALLALGIPFVIIEPPKVVAIWWIGTGHVITGTIALLLAHALSLLVVERVFHAVYQPLMRIGWFAKLLGWLFAIRDRAIELVKATAAWRATSKWARDSAARIVAWYRRLVSPR